MAGGLGGGGALLGLGAAASWGVGDFSGGMGVKHAGSHVDGALRFILLTHATSFAVLLTALWLRGDPFPHGAALYWGLGAGAVAGLAVIAFYVALARGGMGVSAAISGLLAAAIPALVSLFVDGQPGWRRGAGFVTAGVAIWLVAAGENARESSGTAWLATAAGAGFGLYFVGLKYANGPGVLWALATARIGSLVTCGLILVARGLITRNRVQSRLVSGRVLMWVLLTALFDSAGNLLFIASTRSGRLDVAAVLASLYPASTILLAGLVLKERLRRRQSWGMAVAVLAVALITG